MALRLVLHPIMVPLVLLLSSCSTGDRIAMEPATIQFRDVFTCKGLTADHLWVGVTDVFMPEEDPYVVVVAHLAPEDQETMVVYELTNPVDAVVLSEKRSYPKNNPLGISFSMDRLLALGGEGEWRATVYVDAKPIGDSVFYIGEKVERIEEEIGTRYFIVGEESLEKDEAAADLLSDEERYGTYIREVSPELSIPLPQENEPATPMIPSVTP